MDDGALMLTSRLMLKLKRATQGIGNDLLKQENNTHELMSPYMQPHGHE